MSFAKNLKNARLRSGMTQGDLAEKVKVERSTVSKWEVGQRTPTMRKIGQISKALNISLSRLVRYKKQSFVLEPEVRDDMLNKMNMTVSVLKDILGGNDPSREILRTVYKNTKSIADVLKKIRQIND